MTNSFLQIKSSIKELKVPQLKKLSQIIQDELSSREETAEPPTITHYFCSACKLPQRLTPSGLICANGHGGADSISGLTKDQEVAWAKLIAWLADPEKPPIFLLKGFAGTGKSFLMQMLPGLNHNFVFSAPTNKASDVLAKFIGFQVKTTYSVLGLRMTAEDDQMVLTQADDLPNLGNSPILVIDEAGMVPKFMVTMLKQACHDRGWRIIFVGDPAQLTPVGESRSPVWSTVTNPKHKAMLKEVRRFDNELLTLATHLRECVIDTELETNIRTDSKDGKTGVFVLKEQAWLNEIRSKKLEDWTTTKIVVWRNRTADQYNKIVRKALGFKKPFEVGEVILLAAPMFDGGTMVAHTDEELKITSVETRTFTYPEMELEAYVFSVQDRPYSVFSPKDPDRYQELLNKRAAVASRLKGWERKQAWKKFWEVRQQFTPVRYGYCLTSHRLQGSAARETYVDQRDILTNRKRREAARCMYVAGTRATETFKTF